MATRKLSAIVGSEKCKTPLGRVEQHSLIVGGALRNFACCPKGLQFGYWFIVFQCVAVGLGYAGLSSSIAGLLSPSPFFPVL